MSKYTISAIVPVYNTSVYLEKCVNSLLAQNYEHLEIILVDDGSTDESGKICDDYAQKYEQIICIHKENGGLVSAWKEGVLASKGEYLTFVDSDDWIDAGMLGQMSEHLTGNVGEMVLSDYMIAKEKESVAVYQTLIPGEYNRQRLEKEVFPRLLGNEHRTITVSRCMKLISRELILENMKYASKDLSMGEDLAVMFPAFLDCNRIYAMDHKAYYYYRYVDSSMVHKYDRRLYESVELLIRILREVIADKQVNLSHQIDCEYIFFLLLAIKNEGRGNPEGYKENIKAIAGQPKVRQILADTKKDIHISERSNQLLYMVLKQPSGFYLALLRMAMKVFYRQ